MQPRFLRDGSELRSYGGGGLSRKSNNANLFWWTIAITFMMGVATFCWFFSIMVFQHPEKPMNYKVLAKVNKLPIIRKFSVYTVPNGAAKSAKDLLAGYFAYTPGQMEVSNAILKRAYIRNYDRQDPPIYLTGKFQVLEARKLTAADVMTEGWIVRTRSVDLEDVDVEVVLPNLMVDKAPFEVGEVLTLDKRSTFAALVHVERLGEDRFCGTVVPLVYEGFKREGGDVLTMNPPVKLNLEASWPLSQDPGVFPKVVSEVGNP
jgi:hypothetical protein